MIAEGQECADALTDDALQPLEGEATNTIKIAERDSWTETAFGNIVLATDKAKEEDSFWKDLSEFNKKVWEYVPNKIKGWFGLAKIGDEWTVLNILKMSAVFAIDLTYDFGVETSLICSGRDLAGDTGANNGANISYYLGVHGAYGGIYEWKYGGSDAGGALDDGAFLATQLGGWGLKVAKAADKTCGRYRIK